MGKLTETEGEKASPGEKRDLYFCTVKALSLLEATTQAESWNNEVYVFIALPENESESHPLEVEALGINVHVWQYKLLKLLLHDTRRNKEGQFSNNAILYTQMRKIVGSYFKYDLRLWLFKKSTRVSLRKRRNS